MIQKLTYFLLLFTTFSTIGCSQNREEKTMVIIEKMSLESSHLELYKFQLNQLKFIASGTDSSKIVELENELNKDVAVNKIVTAFNQHFSDSEINSIYDFLNTTAFEKLFVTGDIFNVISEEFKDIEIKINNLESQIREKTEKSQKPFIPIPVNRDNGFYEAINYDSSQPKEKVQLKKHPSVSIEDIDSIRKSYKTHDNKAFIDIQFTKEGAKKFYLLTKQNIGNVIPIVIDKKIVAMPIVNSEIISGKASIDGNFSDEEIDIMIQKLKRKK